MKLISELFFLLPVVIVCSGLTYAEVSEKKCLIRENLLLESVFKHYAGQLCYVFAHKSRLNPKLNVTIGRCSANRGVPCANYTENGVVHEVQFDVEASNMTEQLARLFTTTNFFDKWKQCALDAIDCCKNLPRDRPEAGTCPAMWDAWTCWNRAQPGTIGKGPCPNFIYSNNGPSCDHISRKECFMNGTWNAQTDYKTCAVSPRLVARHRFHLTILSISLIVILPAVVIFCCYTKIRTSKLMLHGYLVTAIIVRIIFTQTFKWHVIINALETVDAENSVMYKNGGVCKALAFFEKFAANLVFAIMLLEGVYFHRSIAAAFRREPSLWKSMTIAILVAATSAIVWAITVSVNHDVDCWATDSESGYEWIVTGPRAFALIVNTLLLLDIFRVLLTKLKQDDTKRAAKAALWLAPIFGVPFILTAWKLPSRNCTVEQIFYFFSYSLDGLQGAVVAVIYCYLNPEVQGCLRRSFDYYRNKYHNWRYQGQRSRNTEMNSDRRTTFMTTVDNSHDDIANLEDLEDRDSKIESPRRRSSLKENVVSSIGQTNFGFVSNKSSI